MGVSVRLWGKNGVRLWGARCMDMVESVHLWDIRCTAMGKIIV